MTVHTDEIEALQRKIEALKIELGHAASQARHYALLHEQARDELRRIGRLLNDAPASGSTAHRVEVKLAQLGGRK